MAHTEHEPQQASHNAPPENAGEEGRETGHGATSEMHMTVEVVDMRIEMIKHRKHERLKERTLRWPIHSNTPRITF